jgi:hypothetical protein
MGRELAHALPLLRDREVNWGDRTTLRGAALKTLAWVSSPLSQDLIVYAHAQTADLVTCMVRVEWGHGGASVEEDYPVVHRLRVPLAASMVKLSGRLVDAQGKAPPGSKCVVSAFIAPGSDGETLRNTRFVTQLGSAGVVSTLPEQVMRVEGINAGAADTWVMVFDGPARTGGVPAIVVPARAGRRFRVRRFDGQGFRQGVTWSASSTPLTLVPVKAASLRVDVELLQ